MFDRQFELAAIMCTDILGYTALMLKGEENALELIRGNHARLKPIIGQFRHVWSKEIGEGTLSTLASAVDAVPCAPEVEHIFRGDSDISPRIGLHGGNVIFKDGDEIGGGVEEASWLGPLATGPIRSDGSHEIACAGLPSGLQANGRLRGV